MTIERTNGKLYRSNEYFIKILNDYKNIENKNVKVQYGSCAIKNAEYKDIDFEYDELADTIREIKGIKYTVYF